MESQNREKRGSSRLRLIRAALFWTAVPNRASDFIQLKLFSPLLFKKKLFSPLEMEREKKRTDPASHILSAICQYQVCLINSVAGCANPTSTVRQDETVAGRPEQKKTVLKCVFDSDIWMLIRGLNMS